MEENQLKTKHTITRVRGFDLVDEIDDDGIDDLRKEMSQRAVRMATGGGTIVRLDLSRQ